MHIHSSARISIGTTSDAVGGAPSSQLGQFNVLSSTASGQWVMQGRADNVAGNGLFLRAGNSSSYYTAYLTGYDESNVHMVVRGDGKIGIGTASPDVLLHLAGGSPYIKLHNTGSSASANDIFGALIFQHSDSDDAGITAKIECVAEDNAGNSRLSFHNGDGGNADERLRILSGGQINIGGDYDQTNRFVNINGGSSVGQLQVKGLEADLWLHSTGSGGQWRIIGSTGNTTHRFRIYDNTNSKEPLFIEGSSGTNTSHVHVNSGNLIFDQAGTGINFHNFGTGTNVDNNLLDDYEEGSFSFVKRGFAGGFDSNYAIANQTGKYTKIGRQVLLKGGFSMSGNSGNIGASDYFTLTVGSLPFAPDDTSSGYTGSQIFHQGTWWAYTSLGGGSNAKGSVIEVSGDYLSFYCTSVTGSPSRNSNEITFTISYTST